MKSKRDRHAPVNIFGLSRGGAFALGKILGIPLYIDISWLFAFFLIAFLVGQGFQADYPTWAPARYFVAGIVTSVLFFASVLLHEIGHSLVARVFGIPVISITLFVFGGVARIRNEPSKPREEFLVAIAGPLTSLTLACFFFLLFLVLSGGESNTSAELTMSASVCQRLAIFNTAVAIFNMLPGFPMDGGRVLRAAIWSISGQYERATRVAAGGGSLIAYFFIALGIYMAFFKRDWIDGLWIAFIGMFLLTAARSAIVQLATRRAFVARHVIDIMEHVPYCVSPAMSVRALVDGPILQHGLITFVVEDAGTLRGMVTLNDVKAVPREEWDSTPLQSVMIPAQDLVALRALDSLQRAMELMDERGIHQAPVVEGDRVIGIVTRDGLLRILRTELEFGPR